MNRDETRAILLRAYPDYPNRIEEYLEESELGSIGGFEKFMENNNYFSL